MGMGKTIILGLGNLLLSDEGVGVHVIRGLQELGLPGGVEVVDGGTAGFELLPFLKEAERVIVVDAARGGGKPGSVYRLKPGELSEATPGLSLHQLSLREVLQAAELLGIKPEVVIIGVEPERIAPGMDLSPAVEAALPRAIDAVLKELLD